MLCNLNVLKREELNPNTNLIHTFFFTKRMVCKSSVFYYWWCNQTIEECCNGKGSSDLFDICLLLSDSLAGFVIKTELSLYNCVAIPEPNSQQKHTIAGS